MVMLHSRRLAVGRALQRLQNSLLESQPVFALNCHLTPERLAHLIRQGDILEDEAVRILKYANSASRSPIQSRSLEAFERAVDQLIPSIWLVWPLNVI